MGLINFYYIAFLDEQSSEIDHEDRIFGFKFVLLESYLQSLREGEDVPG